VKLCEANLCKPMFFFSDLRWDFVYQRPQHLLTQAAQDFEVVFIEAPIFTGDLEMWRESSPCKGIHVIQPFVSTGSTAQTVRQLQEGLLEVLTCRAGARPVCLWYYTPLAHDYSRNISADLIIFDKMDELSTFAFAPSPGLPVLLPCAQRGGPVRFRSNRSCRLTTGCHRKASPVSPAHSGPLTGGPHRPLRRDASAAFVLHTG
jgi:hypothetical protein